MTDLDGYGDVRPEWLRTWTSLSRQSTPGAKMNGAHPERSPRVRTLLRAVIGPEGEPGQDVIVRNVSPGGMCIASPTLSPACGETLRVALPGQGNLKAQVRWVGDGEFGIQLLDGLDGGEERSADRAHNARFALALEKLLGVRPHKERSSSGMRAG